MLRWGRRARIRLLLGTAIAAVLITGLGVEHLRNLQLETQITSANQTATNLQGTAADLTSARQQIEALRTENVNLNARVGSLTNQVSALNAQVASLQAQVPPPPVSCTGDPGVRANVNQISLQIVGESTTQALINYLCQNGILSPVAVRNFFNVESLSDLRQRFGYG